MPDKNRVDKLTEEATGTNISEALLSESLSGNGFTHTPIMDYLKESESLDYMLTDKKRGFDRGGKGKNTLKPCSNGRSTYLFTDERMIIVSPQVETDETFIHQHSEIVDSEYKNGIGPGNQRIIIQTTDGEEYHLWLKMQDVKMGKSCSNWLMSKSKGLNEAEGDYVTTERVSKISGVLDGAEKVKYLTRGSTIDVEGSSAGESLFGDDRSRKTGTGGYVRAAFTDKRVVVKVPQWLGNDERSIPYRNITSVDLDTGLVTKRISLQTPGQTYHIEAHEPGKQECRDLVEFARGKMEEKQTNEATVTQEADPTQQLKNLKELHDDEIISDEEFQEKRDSLLDEI